MKARFLIMLLALGTMVRAQETVSLLFAGDAMGHEPQFQWAYNAATDSYNYEPNFRYIKHYIDDADMAFVNLEVTLAGKPYSGYPTFSTPDAWGTALTDAGFDVMVLANNHILDRGKRGLERTLDQVAGVPNAGAYKDAADREARYPLMLEVGGLKIALFNCTYGTNGFYPVAPNKVNYIDTAEIRKDYESIKDKDVDLKVMMIHWGDEYVVKAGTKQRTMAKWLANLGFDLIIGGHPHVVEDAEYLTVKRRVNGEEKEVEVPVVYSLGNLISNQRRLNTNGGIMVRVDIRKADAGVQSVSYLPCYVHKGTISYKKEGEKVTEKHYFLLPTTEYVDGKLPFTLDKESEALLRQFHTNTLGRLSNLPLIKY